MVPDSPIRSTYRRFELVLGLTREDRENYTRSDIRGDLAARVSAHTIGDERNAIAAHDDIFIGLTQLTDVGATGRS
jgi:hypothetical protein